MIIHGRKQISEIVYARKASDGGGAIRLSNIIRGPQVVFGNLSPKVDIWLTAATKQAIMDAFLDDGKAVIKATNAYLNQLAATDPAKASALAGFINQHPLDAALYGGLYVQDGLVFQMDRAYECTAAKWTDFIGGVEFNGTNVQIVDDVPYFNGASASYRNTTNTLAYNYGAVTLEIIYKATVDNSGTNRKFFGVKGGSVSYGALSNNRGVICSDGSCQQFPYTTNAQLTRASVYSDSYAYFNEVFKTASGGNSWGDENINFIGNGDQWNGYAGLIYGIRIYNRKLTEAEILANQEIDLKRFTTNPT